MRARSDLVRKPGGKCGACKIAVVLGDQRGEFLRHAFEPGVRAGARNIGQPLLPQGRVDRLRVLARLGRHAGEDERLDRALVGAHPVDVGGDAVALEQFAEIELFAARPLEHRTAQRIDPDFARVRGEHQRIVGIGDGVGEHRLVGCAEPVERRGDRVQVNLPAAKEQREVERDRLDPLVGGRPVDRIDDVAHLVFACRHRAAREQRGEGIERRCFLDHHALEFEQQRPVAHRSRARAEAEGSEQQREEDQQEEEHEAVLDADEQPPDAAGEATLRLALGSRSGRWRGGKRGGCHVRRSRRPVPRAPPQSASAEARKRLSAGRPIHRGRL